MQRLLIQTKPAISHPGDQFEQEADRVADQVMRMPGPQLLDQSADGSEITPIAGASVQRACPECEEEEANGPPVVQRKCAECEEESSVPPMVQRKCATCEEDLHRQAVEEEEEETIQTKKASHTTPDITPDVQARLNGLRGSGQPLPNSIRTFFEPRFRRDFSSVRVHTGHDASALAQAVQARAFTWANHVVFRSSDYTPGTTVGNQLLAHELTHVVQQGASRHLATESADSIQRAAAASDEPLCEATEFPPATLWFTDPVLGRIRIGDALMALGSLGDAVALVQQAVVAWGCDESLGYLLPRFGVDGVFGSETQAAVKTFQRRQSLDDDGIVGPITIAELDRFISKGLLTCPSGTEPISQKSAFGSQTMQTVCRPTKTTNAEHRFTFSCDGRSVKVVIRKTCGSPAAGFEPSHFKLVEDETREALKKVCDEDCIEEKRRKRFQDNLVNGGGLDIRCNQFLFNCAECGPTAAIITLGAKSFPPPPEGHERSEPGCQTLRSTILHEMVHCVLGEGGEQMPDSCENSCFGTNRGEGPERCRNP